jgi:hypothetical protein
MILGALCVSAICVSGCISLDQPIKVQYPTNNESISPMSSNEIQPFNISRSLYDGNGIFAHVDPETGVNYIILVDYDYKQIIGGICPRYNADGTLYISEVTL